MGHLSYMSHILLIHRECQTNHLHFKPKNLPHKCEFPPLISGSNIGSTYAPYQVKPGLDTNCWVDNQGVRVKNNWPNALGPQEKETSYLHPKP